MNVVFYIAGLVFLFRSDRAKKRASKFKSKAEKFFAKCGL
jgi:hypothetical protein